MEKIKERAEELYKGNTIEMDAYKEGRYEQRAIDDDAIHAIVEEQVLKAIDKQKAIDIEKAIMAHCECCMAYNACKSRDKFSCYETGKIRKAMEE